VRPGMDWRSGPVPARPEMDWRSGSSSC